MGVLIVGVIPSIGDQELATKREISSAMVGIGGKRGIIARIGFLCTAIVALDTIVRIIAIAVFASVYRQFTKRMWRL